MLNETVYHDKFNKLGYVKLPFKIDPNIVDTAVSDMRGRYKYGDENYNLNNRIENAWMFSPAAKKIAGDKRILLFLENIFGVEAFPFQTLNFERGSQQKLHSDFYHFASTKFERMAGVWVALEDINQEAGPLKVVPKSHLLPYLFPEDLKIGVGTRKEPYKFYSKYEKHIEEMINESGLRAEVITLCKGEILVWHSNLIHGGSSVLDPLRTRLSQVTHYFGKGGLYFSPIQSGRSIFSRRYRAPLNVLTGRRVLPFFGSLN